MFVILDVVAFLVCSKNCVAVLFIPIQEVVALEYTKPSNRPVGMLKHMTQQLLY